MGKRLKYAFIFVATNNSLTVADKKHIKTALGAVGVAAVFCND